MESFESGVWAIKMRANSVRNEVGDERFWRMRVKSWSVGTSKFGGWLAVVLCAVMGVGFGAATACAQVTVPPPKDTESRRHGFSVERIFGTSSLLGHPTTGISWAPDGKRLSYFTDLAGGEPKQGRRKELWEMDAASG